MIRMISDEKDLKKHGSILSTTKNMCVIVILCFYETNIMAPLFFFYTIFSFKHSSASILTVVHSGSTGRRAFFQNVFRLAPKSDQAPPPPVNMIIMICDNPHHWEILDYFSSCTEAQTTQHPKDSNDTP